MNLSGPLLDVLLRTVARGDLPDVKRPFALDGLVVAACREGAFAVPGEAEPPPPEMLASRADAAIRTMLRHPFPRVARVQLSEVRSWLGSHARCDECLDSGLGLCPWCVGPRTATCERCDRTGTRACPCRLRDLPDVARFFGFPLDRAVLRRLLPEVQGEISVHRNRGTSFLRIEGEGWTSIVMACFADDQRKPTSFGEGY